VWTKVLVDVPQINAEAPSRSIGGIDTSEWLDLARTQPGTLDLVRHRHLAAIPSAVDPQPALGSARVDGERASRSLSAPAGGLGLPLGPRTWREPGPWRRAKRAALATGCGGSCGLEHDGRATNLSWSFLVGKTSR